MGVKTWELFEQLSEVVVHEPCRVAYCALKTVISVAPEPEVTFNFKANCFLCAQKCLATNKKPFRMVATDQLQTHINSCIEERQDLWSQAVQQRLQSITLLEIQGRYHSSCYNKFVGVSKTHDRGRPKIQELEAAFDDVCQFMEDSDDSQFSLNTLMDRMKGFAVDASTFKQKLRNKYNTDIIIIENRGKPTVVCFRNTGYKILMDSWYQKKATTEAQERLRIVTAAADIIREDIRSKFYETSVYPSPEELLYNVDDNIPESLQVFLDQVLLKGKMNRDEKLTTKRDSIAHSIISVVRPRSFISPIQLATGIYLTRKFGSRLIIDVLNSLGFCASYTNISLYEASAVLNIDKKFHKNAYVQYVYDNADHNVCTLDGFNTFHSMGGI